MEAKLQIVICAVWVLTQAEFEPKTRGKDFWCSTKEVNMSATEIGIVNVKWLYHLLIAVIGILVQLNRQVYLNSFLHELPGVDGRVFQHHIDPFLKFV